MDEHREEREELAAIAREDADDAREQEAARREWDDSDNERELMGLWLSRVMFNMFVGWPPETRTLDEFLTAVRS